MFGKKTHTVTGVTQNLTAGEVKEVSHTFDQTNGVLKAYDDYLSHH